MLISFKIKKLYVRMHIKPYYGLTPIAVFSCNKTVTGSSPSFQGEIIAFYYILYKSILNVMNSSCI